MNVAAHVIAFLKNPKNACALLLFTGLLLFLPSWVGDNIGVTEFITKYKMWLGLGFLGGMVLCLVNIGEGVLGQVRTVRARFIIKNQLRQLSPGEKRVLRLYIDANSKTHVFKVTDGVVGGLEKKGILYRPTEWGRVDRVAYNLHDWIWVYLKRHPDLIDEDDGE